LPNSPQPTPLAWSSCPKSRVHFPITPRKLDLDPAQLSALEQRVSLFETLKAQIRRLHREVIAFGDAQPSACAKIEGRDAELERLTGEIEIARTHLNRTGEALRKLRVKVAPKLPKTSGATFAISVFVNRSLSKLAALDEPRLNGFDSVELLFSPIRVSRETVLRAIASSGEISRLMLAIKSALAAHDEIPLLVFDEIDTNVGVKSLTQLAQRCQTLCRDHQVICITHLAPVGRCSQLALFSPKKL